METHEVFGDFKVSASTDYGPGNLRVVNNCVIEGDLTVLGDTVNNDVTTVVSTDALIGVNNNPLAPDKDGGISIEIHPDNLVTTETGTVISATTNTVTYTPVAADYTGWKIEITGGTGVGQIRTVDSYAAGTATLDTDWTTIPDGTSTYNFYQLTHAHYAYNTQTDEFFIGTGPLDHTADKLTPTTPGTLIVGTLVQTLNQEIIYYVGKHGDDSASGRTIGEAFLTVGAAVTAAGGGAATVRILDDGVYSIASLPVNIKLVAPAAEFDDIEVLGEAEIGKIDGRLRVSNGSIVKVGEIDNVGNTAVVRLTNGGTTPEVTVGSAACTTFLDAAGDVNIKAKKVVCTTGITTMLAAIVNANFETLVATTAYDADDGTEIYARATQVTVTNISETNSTGKVVSWATNSNNETDLGSGTLLWGDVERVDDHISDISNPHSVTIDQVSPLTTKGDLLVFDGTNNVRLPVGTTGQVIFADPVQPLGVRWDSPATANGLAAFVLEPKPTNAITDEFELISSFPFSPLYASLVDPKLIFYVTITTSNVEIKAESGGVLAQQTISSTGFYNIPLLGPTGNTIDVSVRKIGTGAAPVFSAIVLQWGTAENTTNLSTDYDLKIVNPPTYTVMPADYVIFVNTSSPCNISLPLIAGAKRRLFIIDRMGSAGTNNITITANVLDSIEGLPTATINTNFGKLELITDTTIWYKR